MKAIIVIFFLIHFIFQTSNSYSFWDNNYLSYEITPHVLQKAKVTYKVGSVGYLKSSNSISYNIGLNYSFYLTKGIALIAGVKYGKVPNNLSLSILNSKNTYDNLKLGQDFIASYFTVPICLEVNFNNYEGKSYFDLRFGCNIKSMGWYEYETDLSYYDANDSVSYFSQVYSFSEQRIEKRNKSFLNYNVSAGYNYITLKGRTLRIGIVLNSSFTDELSGVYVFKNYSSAASGTSQLKLGYLGFDLSYSPRKRKNTTKKDKPIE